LRQTVAFPAPGRRRHHILAALGYIGVALLFAWPLPLHLAEALPGSPSGDTGVYVWNLWVFRHQILVHQAFPFATLEILNLDRAAVPLALHNYTTVANLLAFPFIGLIGTVATFNVLTIGTGAVTAYAMFLYALRRTGDAGAAFAGGLLFGFNPFMTARSTEHFSLAQAAPLPIFGLLMLLMFQNPGPRLAACAGLVVAWAYLSDPYYAVYCLLIAVFMVGYSLIAVERRPEPVRRIWWTAVVNLLLLCLFGLIVGIALRGGGRVELLGLRISVTRLYTPVLLFTLLALVRLWMTVRTRIRWRPIFRPAYIRAALVGAMVCVGALAPVVVAMASAGGRIWTGPRVWWRSSAPGVDAAAWLIPNPFSPWFGGLGTEWLAGLPNGFVENVASVSWVAVATIAIAVVAAGFKGTRGWWVFTGVFALLSLGPFIRIAGIDTYLPTPWALLRYLPVVGAARMPTRMTVLVMLGFAMLFALALQHLRARSRRPWVVTAIAVACLGLELLPTPRRLFSAAVPDVARVIAADPREVKVLNLPFGLKDGLGGGGRFSTAYQYHQTVHEKPLIGGYLSRLPGGAIERYRRDPVLRVVMRLSEGRPLEPELVNAALAAAPEFMARTQLGYVVVDTSRASQELVDFAIRAFSLAAVDASGEFLLFRTPLASPPAGSTADRLPIRTARPPHSAVRNQPSMPPASRLLQRSMSSAE
jgi:hypothetical protein